MTYVETEKYNIEVSRDIITNTSTSMFWIYRKKNLIVSYLELITEVMRRNLITCHYVFLFVDIKNNNLFLVFNNHSDTYSDPIEIKRSLTLRRLIRSEYDLQILNKLDDGVVEFNICGNIIKHNIQTNENHIILLQIKPHHYSLKYLLSH